MIFVFGEINNKILFNFKANFSLFNTEKTKSLIIPIYYM